MHVIMFFFNSGITSVDIIIIELEGARSVGIEDDKAVMIIRIWSDLISYTALDRSIDNTSSKLIMQNYRPYYVIVSHNNFIRGTPVYE